MMPGGYSLNIYRGDDHAWRFTLWQDAEKTLPVDLTGQSVKAEIRDRPAGDVVQVLEVAVTLPNTIDVVLRHQQTSQLIASGRWDMQLTDGSGWVSTVLAGNVKVTGDITDSTGEPTSRQPQQRRAGYLVGADA
jgi:hypothetical protein